MINGSDQCSGRVEVYHNNHWLPAINLNWGMNEATVVCREMNCGDPVKATGSFGQSEDLRGYQVTCNGRESSLGDCSLREYTATSRNRVADAGVECSGKTEFEFHSLIVDGHIRCNDTAV